MSVMNDTDPPAPALSNEQRLAALLELTGDLDHAQVLDETLPRWLYTTQEAVLKALEQALASSLRYQLRVEQYLRELEPPEQFCARQLRQHLPPEWEGPLDVELDLLELPRRVITGGDLGGVAEEVTYDYRTLVHAAMQGFTEGEAQGSDLSPRAVILSSGTKKAAQVSPVQFARYCRQLDLGKRYQAHVREVFKWAPAVEDPAYASYSPAAVDISRLKSLDMQIDLHIAYAMAHISESTYRQLLTLNEFDGAPPLAADHLPQGRKLKWQGLKIHGCCLWGALVFSSTGTDSAFAGQCVVYLPNEPVRPLYEYPSPEAFKLYLGLKLRVPSYRKRFERYLSEVDRDEFFRRMDDEQGLGSLEPLPAATRFSDFVFNAYTGRALLDARVLVVPNGDVDAQQRDARFMRYLDAGLTLANVAGFFVPVLGQLMLGVAIGEMLGETYEAVQDWRHQDRHEALGHVLSVAQSLASLAAFAAAGKVVGSALGRLNVSTQEHFAQFEVIHRADGSSRLWRVNLRPYRQPESVIEGLTPDPKGLYQRNGAHYLRLEGDLYQVGYDAPSGQWSIHHPTREDAYRLPLEHNGERGWRHVHEHEWSDADYALRRIDPRLGNLAPRVMNYARAITGLDLAQAQQLARESRPLPARFEDCVNRFRLDQQVRDLRWQLEQGHYHDPETAVAKMNTLPLLPGWPKGRFFEVLDSAGEVAARYPEVAPFDYADLSILITEQEVAKGLVLDTLLRTLSEEETLGLLGSHPGLTQARALLAGRLIQTLKQQHKRVFDLLYAAYDSTASAKSSLVREVFPQLPVRLIRQLRGEMSTVEQQILSQRRRVPLHLAQKAREAWDAVQVDRAICGLYVPELANDDTYRMIGRLLARLEGWPREGVFEVRDNTVDGPLLDTFGRGASPRNVLVRAGETYQAFDRAGQSLGVPVEGPESFYQALLNALSREEHTALGIGEESVRKWQLQAKLMRLAEDDRPLAVRAVHGELAEPDTAWLACAQASPAELAPHPASLLRKVRHLFPLLDDAQLHAFIDNLGSDHVTRATAFKALQQQHQALRAALRTWRSQDAQGGSSLLARIELRRSREIVANRIERCWRHMLKVSDEYNVSVPGLELDNLQVGSLPTLPAQVEFRHVRRLSLGHMGLGDDAAYFLKHFPEIESLDLTRNRLTRVPEVLSHLAELKQVYLDSNQLQLNDYGRRRLAGLTRLRTLSLNDNPLGDAPDVSRLFDLRCLLLRDTRARSVPEGLQRLPNLELVDLRGNDISTLPAWLFRMSRRFSRAINLRLNPLSESSREALLTYRNTVGVGMGYVEDDIVRLNEQAARELWLGHEHLPTSSRSAIWQGLKDDPASEGLFKLLAELGGAADTSYVHEDMVRRVWDVLHAASTDAALRSEIFDRAATPINCDDAAALNFSSLEVLVEIDKASRLVGSPTFKANAMAKLGRGLFRLDQLENIAQTFREQHPHVDPLEVSLAYRTGLARELELPGQPQHMRYASLSGVTSDALNRAEGEVRQAELSTRLPDFLVQQPFWLTHLRRRFAAVFERLNLPFHQRMHAAFSRSQALTDQAYRDQVDEIQREQEQAQERTYRRLTLESLSDDAPTACPVP
ncbi:Leucine rich repeat-containing protein [Pseudomonas sp. ok272]|uniref:NEL-type E3 ubiquitin ligase domain-containing protein n=1 Tax=unclassified Pseudomonas TaxID=196821 RepID=UPI0008BFF1C5|nr:MULTISPECIES: NEL-type E3 ubiquitin ligase domain-containing protein [unclassified Pseudomonas]SEN05153.1 Leucine rich repeat-containing protein [Pseudomonas sp. ok272]SFN01005.1 Leucine rich repeat-containing protein [Pseudomonas sp. ok602]